MTSTPLFESETHREVWDTHGGVTEIGPDRDGLDCVEIRLRDTRHGDQHVHTSMSFHPAQARLVAHAMLACCAELDPLQEEAK